MTLECIIIGAHLASAVPKVRRCAAEMSRKMPDLIVGI
jgi:hypothetical protein